AEPHHEEVYMAPGWSYFVENDAYREHIRTYIDQDEMKHCESPLAAVGHANMPATKRFAVNGVGAVICAWYCFYRKSSVGDLQRGERYRSRDWCYVTHSALLPGGVHHRMAQYPEGWRIRFGDVIIVFVIPKFHILGHSDKCQNNLDINKTEGLGRMCGE
ncbi:hypothetical protein FA95DRAFT_1449922, partial [Auriscalpium vulgare]